VREHHKVDGGKSGRPEGIAGDNRQVSDDSIFLHTYQYFLKEHILEYTNDFAQWAGESLEERALAEQLSNIDPYSFESIADLPGPSRGDRFLPRKVPGTALRPFRVSFFFNETVTFVFPVGVYAKNLAEFFIAMRFVDSGCIYYHFTRHVCASPAVRTTSPAGSMRPRQEGTGGKDPAIDPSCTAREIRTHISDIIMEEVSREMEKVEVHP
jgi:hypothetical protein